MYGGLYIVVSPFAPTLEEKALPRARATATNRLWCSRVEVGAEKRDAPW